MFEIWIGSWIITIIVLFLRFTSIVLYAKSNGIEIERKDSTFIGKLISLCLTILVCGIPLLNIILTISLLLKQDKEWIHYILRNS